MINISDIMQTNAMIDNQHLDIRTVTMGISLRDCCDPDIDKCCEKIYKKITSYAKNLVPVPMKLSLSWESRLSTKEFP